MIPSRIPAIELASRPAATLALPEHHADSDPCTDIDADLPMLVALFELAASAGANARTSLATVASVAPGATGLRLTQIAERLQLGEDYSSAIAPFIVDRSGFARLLELLARADADGVELPTHLAAIRRESQTARQNELESHAQQLTVRLLLPLVLCILPAFVLLSIVPLVVGVIGDLPGR